MSSRQAGERLPGLRVLLCAGTAVGMSDGQLLECFATRDGDGSELAFAALVERHGPMVLRTCRAVLRQEHDAWDAYQATFLILVRHGGSLWVRDSIGPWLHQVAYRAAVRARRDSERRRSMDRSGTPAVEPAAAEVDRDDLGHVVHEEVDRLPDRYRVPIVLCDLEGRTNEEVAKHLGCPVGTVKSRLARGRERLRSRLERRGLAPGVAFGGGIRATVPAALQEATSKAVMRLVVGEAAFGPISATVASITEGVLRSMFMTNLRAVSIKVVLGMSILVAIVATDAASRAQQGPERTPPPAQAAAKKSRESPPENPPTSYAWQGTDRYDPPDFARFFPDDPEGGRRLDLLWQEKDRLKRPATEILRTVREGLRRTRVDREEVLKEIGGRFVWNASPQDPEAIEILYHAMDFRGPLVHFSTTPSIYYGFMRIQPKPPAVLHALVDWCLHVQNYSDWDSVGWAGRSQRAELLAYLRPALNAKDEETRERAAVLEKVLGEAKDHGEALRAWIEQQVSSKSGHLLPGIRQALLSGGSSDRNQALEQLLYKHLTLILDESFLPAFRACADDPSPSTRRALCRALSGFDVSAKRPWAGDAIDLLLRLSKDSDRQVRYDAVYYGLTPLPQTKRQEVIRRLLDMALFDRQLDLLRRIAWGLESDRDLAVRMLNEDLRGSDRERARSAREVYKEMTGRTPPNLEKSDLITREGYIKAFRDLYDHLGRVYPSFGIKGIDWEAVGKELLPRADELESEEQFGRLVEQLVARLEDSHAIVMEGASTPPPPGLPEWDPGLACLIDNRERPVVYVVPETTPAWKAGVRPGMTVVAVNGVPASEAMDRWEQQQRKFVGYSSERYLRYDAARLFHRRKEQGEKVALTLEDIDGRNRTVELIANFRSWYIPRLPVPRAGIEDGGADVQWVPLKPDLGYISVRRIRAGLEVSLDQALASLGAIKGLILDVRGNSGGGFDTKTAFLNFDRTRGDAPAPHRPLYKGPIALLIDERCTSAGEGWSSWFVANKRARLFGTATAGTSSRKESYKLSNGLYTVQVPVKAYTGFLDRPIERLGLTPDVEVRCSALDVSRGRDTVAEEAADWLVKMARE